MISGRQFAAVNRHNILDGVVVRNVLWAVNCAALHGCLSVVNFNNFSSFRLRIYLANWFLDRQNSRMLRLKKMPNRVPLERAEEILK